MFRKKSGERQVVDAYVKKKNGKEREGDIVECKTACTTMNDREGDKEELSDS